MTSRVRAALLAAALALVAGVLASPVAPAAPPPFEVLRGGDVVAGRTVRAWTGPYTVWDVERRKRSDCRAGQRGRMFFLPTSDGGNQRADCEVPLHRPVFLMPAGLECWDFDSVEQLVTDCRAPSIRRLVRRVEVTVDGRPIAVRAGDWTGRHGFRVKGTPAAVSCYCYAIRNLAPGPHRIALYDEIAPPGEPVFRARMTIRLEVVPPPA
jgi:hypothetical protein